MQSQNLGEGSQTLSEKAWTSRQKGPSKAAFHLEDAEGTKSPSKAMFEGMIAVDL
jgi:hypothetical protein